MPIFEFKCPECGARQEVLYKSSSAKSPTCEKCGKIMEKQFSTFAAVTKEAHQPGPGCHGCQNSCPHAH